MVGLSRGIGQRSSDVVGLDVGKVVEDLLRRYAFRQQREDSGDPDTCPSNTRPSAAYIGVDRDSLEKGHVTPEYRGNRRSDIGLKRERKARVKAAKRRRKSGALTRADALVSGGSDSQFEPLKAIDSVKVAVDSRQLHLMLHAQGRDPEVVFRNGLALLL